MMTKKKIKKKSEFTELVSERMEVYQSKSDKFLTSHQLIDFVKDPKLFYKRFILKSLLQKEDSNAFRLGTAFHLRILEPDEFKKSVVIYDEVNPTTGLGYGSKSKKFKVWQLENVPENGITLLPDEALQIEQMRQGILENKTASKFLEPLLGKKTNDFEVEKSCRGMLSNTLCQGRIDYFTDSGLFDLKSISNMDKFASQFETYHYGIQLSFYRLLLAKHYEVKPEDIPLYIIAVEKQEPFCCVVFFIDPATSSAAERIIFEKIDEIEKAMKGNQKLMRETFVHRFPELTSISTSYESGGIA